MDTNPNIATGGGGRILITRIVKPIFSLGGFDFPQMEAETQKHPSPELDMGGTPILGKRKWSPTDPLVLSSGSLEKLSSYDFLGSLGLPKH